MRLTASGSVEIFADICLQYVLMSANTYPRSMIDRRSNRKNARLELRL